MMPSSRRVSAAVIALGLVAVAFGGAEANASTPTTATVRIVAQFASFDRAAGRDQRVLVGLLNNRKGQVAYGTVKFRFAFLGTRESPVRRARADTPVTATYRALPGVRARQRQSPRIVSAAESRGVYAADGVRFDRPGLWSVIVTGRLGKEAFAATAAFEVNPEPYVVAEGEDAPRTVNPLPGEPGVATTAIDSRATNDAAVPDPELHATTIAGALAAGKPVIIVVSTPVYCTSRFCGPITDSIQKLAQEYGDRIAFVHLEVWNDFEDQIVNDAAAEWITPRGGSDRDLREPWVFAVGADGKIVVRFDNVASEDELRATAELLAG